VSTSTAPGSDVQKPADSGARIFEDPNISAAAQGDPVAKFIAQNYKPILITLIAVALGMLAYNSFKATAEAKRAAATQLFTEIRENYVGIVQKQDELMKAKSAVPADDKAKADAQQKTEALQRDIDQLRQKTKLMIDSLDSPKPFDLLARLYGGLIAARFKEYDAVNAALTNITWQTVGRAGSPERFVAELATLGLAKALLGSDKDRGAAREALVSLAERGEFAAVQAVMALASSSSTPDDQNQARTLIDTVRQRFPSQEKFLKQAEDDLGA
jgi:hypothetical protein